MSRPIRQPMRKIIRTSSAYPMLLINILTRSFLGGASALTLLLSITIVPGPAQAQTPSIEKTPDGRFQTTVTASYSLLRNQGMTTFELDLEWWTLIDQFVYYHQTEWTPSSVIDYRYQRSELYEHDDFIERFDEVAPTNVRLEMDIELSGFDASQSQPNCLTERQAVLKLVVRLDSTPHFPIAPAGKKSDPLTPASPKLWTDVFDVQNGRIDFCKAGVDGAEERIFNTFKSANTLSIADLRVEEISWPESTLDSIFRELERRNNVDEADDPFADEKEPEAELETLDDPFARADAGRQERTDDPFAMAQETGSQEASDPFTTAKASTDFEIKRDERGEGVVDSSGRTIIPFRDWEIKEVRGNLAFVAERSTKRVGPSRETGGGCSGPGACLVVIQRFCPTEMTTRTYWTDIKGQAVTEPSVEIAVFDQSC